LSIFWLEYTGKAGYFEIRQGRAFKQARAISKDKIQQVDACVYRCKSHYFIHLSRSAWRAYERKKKLQNSRLQLKHIS
jgi:hypothetical protein